MDCENCCGESFEIYHALKKTERVRTLVRHDDIDSWKGLLIFFVVFAHALGGVSHVVPPDYAWAYQWIWQTIYVFHMAAFFSVAGMLWKRPTTGLAVFLKKKAFRLLVPYFVFGLGSLFVYQIIGRWAIAKMLDGTQDSYYSHMSVGPLFQSIVSLIHAGGWPNGEGFRMNLVLWFLPCMFSTTIAYYFLDRFSRERKLSVAVGGIISISLFLVLRKMRWNWWPWGLDMAALYLFFMVFGDVCVRRIRMLAASVSRVGLAVGVVMGWTVLLVCSYKLLPIWNQVLLTTPHFLLYTLFGLYGIVLSQITALLLSCRMLSVMGKASLCIMLLHKFIVVGMQFLIPSVSKVGFQSPILGGFGSAIVISFASIVICVWAKIMISRYVPWVLGEKHE